MTDIIDLFRRLCSAAMRPGNDETDAELSLPFDQR